MSDKSDIRSLIERVVDTALIPIHAATSKPAQRAYLGTFLFAITSLILLSISTIAYTLFYYNFVPQIGVQRTIHLQFGNGPPFGTASLASTLTSLQAYDISLFLHLPRTPANLAAGNFMIDLSLFSASAPLSSPADLIPSSVAATNTSASILARSRRPAILTYTSPIVDTAHKLSGLPWYVLGWKKESEVLEVSMFEGVEFARGSKNVPDNVQVVIEADEKMQFYEVGISIVARFGGLRYILYNHRILSYLFFTTTFFTVATTSTFIGYLILSSILKTPTPSEHKSSHQVKAEPDNSDDGPLNPLSTSDLSDTSRHFPTLSRQRPLHFPGRNESTRNDEVRIKTEEEEIERTTGIQPLTAEADDEDEFDDRRWRDSGIGTSLEEGNRRGVQRRKR